jgi:hypothetical protein
MQLKIDNYQGMYLSTGLACMWLSTVKKRKGKEKKTLEI